MLSKEKTTVTTSKEVNKKLENSMFFAIMASAMEEKYRKIYREKCKKLLEQKCNC
jgi:DNA invertase Pin-like site-specific DNA recombinase